MGVTQGGGISSGILSGDRGRRLNAGCPRIVVAPLKVVLRVFVIPVVLEVPLVLVVPLALVELLIPVVPLSAVLFEEVPVNC